ncbi:MAG: Methylphosphotriester-DNA--protein-cysteine S-methyltransferase (EC / ADA regulatory protein / Methylated-DNA--protein-cysteine methyltransferase [uncultured Chloroflexia bacterium]|uniref:methylated-DNA--[protein]-cysteine S-methyltransferase n=1 Tax=uncultured Chloroflexia bacterium TaxID=1672391 RepID=A0A6J4MV89_9CHLR|nr:MAG: Methylphosphotriester-DNA--protein-cysteine S-methyltransferase (EC / ADA regulatory protein / Methylated-DNA--protein-cysteine methyltransferase [uncultured Chloroflexia bacterium]
MNDQHSEQTRDEARWHAVSTRVAVVDQAFYYAVRTTGIFCKPSCPSRRPLCANVEFFDTVAAAEDAGYRACRRCTPTATTTATMDAVERARHLIVSALDEPTLEELGAAVGLAPTYLQRVFKKQIGVSPKQYARAHRVEQVKTHLRSDAQVTAALYEAGYGSSHGFYREANTQLGMRPLTYRQGAPHMHISYTIIDSSLGALLIAATEQGICAVQFGDEARLEADLRAEFPGAQIQREDAVLAPQACAILAHLAGEQAELDLPLAVQATAFQARVWNALRAIPYGETRSYTEVARQLGEPRAVRAVARACATNPVALVIPCHRVVRSDGELAGYRWVIERKRALLGQEQALAMAE